MTNALDASRVAAVLDVCDARVASAFALPLPQGPAGARHVGEIHAAAHQAQVQLQAQHIAEAFSRGLRPRVRKPRRTHRRRHLTRLRQHQAWLRRYAKAARARFEGLA